MRRICLTAVGVLALAGAASAQTINTVAGGGIPPVGLKATLWGASYAAGTAVDASGNLYVSVIALNQVWEISPAGAIAKVIGTGAVGYSGDGGPASAARLNSPWGLALDASGNLYIADTSNNVVRKVTAATGIITTFAGTGTAGYSGDGGLPTSAALNSPTGVAVGSKDGNIFIADLGNNRIREITVSTGKISTVAGSGVAGYSGDGGAATSAELNAPWHIAVESTGAIDIADTKNNRIRRVTQSNGLIATVAGTGTAGFAGDGAAATSAELSAPVGIALDASGNIIVGENGNHRIRRFAVGGNIATIAGNGVAGYSGDGAAATSAMLYDPVGLSLDASGNIYVADDVDGVVRVFAPGSTIKTIAGNGSNYLGGDGGPATSALLQPQTVAVDAAGNLYIADNVDSVVRKVTASTGVIATVAGTGTAGYSGDGGAATSARLNQPYGVALDGSGNLYIADSSNHRVRKVTASTGVITTFAGTGTAGYSGDGGAATSAQLSLPQGVAVDASGNLYIADGGSVVRKVAASSGTISTVAGTGKAGYSGDNGPAASATLNFPSGVAVDGSGNVYIADTSNNRVRKVSAASGAITTVAGNGTAGYGGDGAAATSAELNNPQGVAVDANGNLYIADSNNSRIREVTAGGWITTAAGNGSAGFGGDGAAATSAQLNFPGGVAVSAAGNLYIADTGNLVVREVTTAATPAPSLTQISPVSATAGGAAFTLTVTGSNFGASAQVFWNGTGLSTTFTSSTMLTAAVPAALIASAGSAMVTVSSGGMTSNALTFSVTAAVTAAPALTTLSPASAMAGGAAFTLTVTGSNFGLLALVQWNGTALPTTFTSSTSLTAAVSASLIASAGSASVTVSSGGMTSNALTFSIVTGSAPALTQISPASEPAGGAAFVLNVTGSNFGGSAQILWNGSALTTLINSSTMLTATIPASLIKSAGSASITVYSGGAMSNALTFTVTAAPPPASGPPQLVLSATTLTPAAIRPGSNGPAQSVEAQNAGGGSLNLTATSTASWLSATIGAAQACVVLTGTCLPVNITLATSSLAAGTYTEFITLSDPNALDSPKQIAVTVTVAGVPSSLTFYVGPAGSTNEKAYAYIYPASPVTATVAYAERR